ncbi:MAG: hypothetical protein AAFQ87_07500 [Bacteroidota bacterium]
MKKPLLFALFGLIVISLSAQTEIVLNLQHQFDGNDFVMDDALYRWLRSQNRTT